MSIAGGKNVARQQRRRFDPTCEGHSQEIREKSTAIRSIVQPVCQFRRSGDLVRNGTEVQILDAKTGEDLTRGCLMQIVMEDAKEQPTGLPLELLRQLVVASDHVGREFIMWYLNSAFDAYRKVQNTVEDGLSEVKSAASSPLQLVKTFIQSTVSERQSEKQAEENELQELRKRVAELEKKAGNPTRKRRRSKTTRSSPTR